MRTAVYLDSSALAKLVLEEDESGALQAWLDAQPGLHATCDLARTETVRAVGRMAPADLPKAHDLLRQMTIGEVSQDTFAAASRLGPPELRSLDAIHLASALELGDALDAFVTYDERLAEAATMLGLPVVAPS